MLTRLSPIAVICTAALASGAFTGCDSVEDIIEDEVESSIDVNEFSDDIAGSYEGSFTLPATLSKPLTRGFAAGEMVSFSFVIQEAATIAALTGTYSDTSAAMNAGTVGAGDVAVVAEVDGDEVTAFVDFTVTLTTAGNVSTLFFDGVLATDPVSFSGTVIGRNADGATVFSSPFTMDESNTTVEPADG